MESESVMVSRHCHPVAILETARKHAEVGSWEEAFEMYVSAFVHLTAVGSVGKDTIDKLESEFALTMSELAHFLLETNRHDELYAVIGHALRVYPEGSFVLYQVGRSVLRAGHLAEACGFLQKSLRIDPAFAQAEKYVNVTKHLLVDRWHFRMLNDRRRNLSYRRAIEAVLEPDDVVLDVGCGSGLLSFYAADACGHTCTVIACDSNDALTRVAGEAVDLNCFDNIVVRKDLSTNLEVDDDDDRRRFSAVVTEIFDAGLFGENALESILDAWDRLLIPKGKIVPKAAVVYICGVESITLAKKFRVVRTEENRLFTLLKFNNINIFRDVDEPYDTEDLTLIKDVKYVTEPVEIVRFDFQDPDSIRSVLGSTLEQTIRLTARQDCKVDAYAMWFDLILCEGVSITSDPRSAERCTAWDAAIFHTVSALDCRRDQDISVDIVWVRGIIYMVYQNYQSGVDFPVHGDIVRILNDTEYVNNMITTVSFSCLHLMQLYYLFEHISVLDNTPIPIVGMLLLVRGIAKLTYTNAAVGSLLEKLAEYNNIEFDKFVYDDDMTLNENDKYEMIVNNFIRPMGTLYAKTISMASLHQEGSLQTNGTVVPHRIKMYVRLVNSKYLNEFNRVYDENLTDVDHQQCKEDETSSKRIDLNASIDSLIESNVWHRTGTHPVFSKHNSNTVTNVTDDIEKIKHIRSIWANKSKSTRYKIAELMNCYQVTHNSFPPSDEFEKSYLSDEGCVYEDCAESRFSSTVKVTATSDGHVDAIQSYYKIQLVPDGEEMSTDHIDSFINNMYHLIDPPVQVYKGKTVNVLVFCEDTDAVKMVVDDGS
ncbi:uncharacterized protein LOC143915178 [Arctopsyche grandis]|uniref:uncharacterized protein LOC143915178 n=1 Tax=Arctopsyche grandis TaxID=121162 RepID=UPI00406D9965